jgi:hypothetical protein
MLSFSHLYKYQLTLKLVNFYQHTILHLYQMDLGLAQNQMDKNTTRLPCALVMETRLLNQSKEHYYPLYIKALPQNYLM